MKIKRLLKMAVIFAFVLTCFAFVTASAQNMFTNGDIEGEDISMFTTTGSTVSKTRVVDPYDENNHALLVENDNKENTTQKVWVYIRQNPELVPGATYTFSCDFAVMNDSQGNEITSALPASMNFNAYYRENGTLTNHNNEFGKYKTSDKWVHVEKTFTVSENYTHSTSNYIGVYANPITLADSTIGNICYMIDNLSLVRDPFSFDATVADGMRIQVGTPFELAGQTTSGTTVTATVKDKDGKTVSTGSGTVTDGSFTIAMPAINERAGAPYSITFDNGTSQKVINNVKILASLQNLFDNGDIEDTDISKFSTTGAEVVATRVVDPTDSANHVLSVDCETTEKKVWVYIRQKPVLEAGATYTFKCDIAIKKDSQGNDVTIALPAELGFNARYYDNGAIADHASGLGSYVTSGGWTHIEKTFTVSSAYTHNASNYIGIYVNPITYADGKIANISYMIDNFELERVTYKLPDVISDNMMIQSDQPFKLWGESELGTSVTATLRNKNGVVVAEKTAELTDGNFSVEMPAVAVSDDAPYTITFNNGETSCVVKNVIFGDLWLFSGQSNMQLSVMGCGNSSDRSYIDDMLPGKTMNDARFFVASDNGTSSYKWVVLSDSSVFNISAVGYNAVKTMQEKLGRPVGGLSTAMGGMTMQTFTVGGDVYNSRMKPFEELNFKGFMWYQGENNAWSPDFTQLLDTMVKSWRGVWGELPFIYVQLPQSPATIPNFTQDLDENGNPTKTATFDYTDVRAYQNEYFFANRDTNDVGMVVSFDTTTHIDPQKSVEDKTAQDPLHPWNKKPIGTRLGNYALAMVYGVDVEHLSPEIDYAYVDANGDTVVVYKNVATGLTTTDGLAPRFFEVCDTEGTYYKVEASITAENTVKLETTGIENIAKVAYAHENHFYDKTQAFVGMDTNFVNQAGLPGLPQTVEVTDAPETVVDKKPTTSNKIEVRTREPAGLRFFASVTDEQKLLAAEYGYIVSTEKILGATELTFDCGKKFTSGIAYKADGSVDIVFDKGVDFTTFTAVTYGIPEKSYTEKMVVRPYLKTEDDVYYGNAVSASLYETAKAILASGGAGELPAETKAYLEGVVKAVEGQNGDVDIDIGGLYE